MKTALFAVALLLFLATGVITLLAIIQKVSIDKKYLNALFGAFLLELTASVLLLFSGADFFAPLPITNSQTEFSDRVRQAFPGEGEEQILLRLSEIPKLEDKIRLSQSELSLMTILHSELSNSNVLLESELTQRNTQIKWLNDELEVRKEAVIQLTRLERKFLVRMAELNSSISDWGSSINFRWQSEEKRNIALLLQEAFKEIGFMPELGIPNDDPMLAHEILVRFQEENNFKEVGFLTSQVVAFIVLDYLSPDLNR